MQGIFPGGKDGRCVGSTTLTHSCGDYLDIWETQISGTLRASNMPVMGLLYFYILSYYVEHYVSLAIAGPSQTRVGLIAISHYLHLAFFTTLLGPCMSVKLLSADWSNTVHLYRCKNNYTRTVKLHFDMFQWRPPPSPGKTTPQTRRHRYLKLSVLSYTHRLISLLLNTQLVYVTSTSQYVDNNIILSVHPAVHASTVVLHN
jgi:hypothetical protein